jgi:type I restriction enzyme S subunit
MGTTAIAERPLITNQTFIGLLPRSSSLDPRFLYWSLQGFRDHLTATATGAIQQYLSRDDFRQLRLPIPSPQVQTATADYLDIETARIDALIDKKLRMNATLQERLTAAIASEMSAAPIRRRLRHLAVLGTGHTPDRSKPEYWENCVIPWVTAADLSGSENPFDPLLDTAQKVSKLGVEKSSAVVHPAGTVMLCRTASVGLLCQIGVPMATTQAFVTWTPGPELDSTFLLFVLTSMAQEWKKLAFGSTHETIYMPDLESVRIPFFSLTDQHMVVERLLTKVGRVQVLRRSLAKQIIVLRERRQALITAAVTGQIEVPGVAA